MIILPLMLIQEEHLSVGGEKCALDTGYFKKANAQEHCAWDNCPIYLSQRPLGCFCNVVR